MNILTDFLPCCVFLWFNLLFYVYPVILFILSFTPFFWIPLAYVFYYIFDRKSLHFGRRRINCIRNIQLWKHFVNYFPIRFHKVNKKPFDSTKNYIFMSHPHGFFCFGMFFLMCTEALNWAKHFPGLEPHVVSHHLLYAIPCVREFFLFFGNISSCEESFNSILSKSKGGKALGLIVGGAHEMLLMKQNNYKLVLKNRMGYARIALKYGTCLVPTISFGENDYFYLLPNQKGTILRLIQDFCRSIFSFGFTIIFGRGMYFPFGIFPLKKPINVVVGDPIEVPKVENPTTKQIVMLHEIYKAKLVELFENEKYKYIKNAKYTKLKFVS